MAVSIISCWLYGLKVFVNAAKHTQLSMKEDEKGGILLQKTGPKATQQMNGRPDWMLEGWNPVSGILRVVWVWILSVGFIVFSGQKLKCWSIEFVVSVTKEEMQNGQRQCDSLKKLPVFRNTESSSVHLIWGVWGLFTRWRVSKKGIC